MFVARRTRAPRCARCGRVTAPYSICLPCSNRVGAAPEPAPEAAIEDLIAAALPDEGYGPASYGGETLEPVPAYGYDPEDMAIPRDQDVFLGARSGRWRRIF